MMKLTRAAAIAVLLVLSGCSSASAQLESAGTNMTAKAPAALQPAVPQFFPPDTMQIGMYILVGLVLLVAAGGGVGGGPLLVPLYLLLGRFTNTKAVALSNAAILAGSVANVLVVVPRRRHPIKDRPLVAWDLITLMQPPTSIGAIWGAYINKLMPPWVAQVLLALLLAVMSWRISNRATFIFKQETLAKLEQQTQSAVRAAGRQQPAAKLAAPDSPAQCSGEQAGDGTVDGKVASKQQGDAEAEGNHHQQQEEEEGQHPRLNGIASDATSESAESAHSCSMPRAEGALPAEQQPQQHQEQCVPPNLKAIVSVRTTTTRATGHCGAEPNLAAAGGSTDASDDDWEVWPESSQQDAPPTEAEAKLAYAPPQKRPGGGMAGPVDLGAGAVEGVPVSRGPGDPALPAPEMAADRVGEALRAVLASESRQLPPWHIGSMVAMCGTLLMASSFSKRQPCGSWPFWVMQAAVVPVLLAISFVARGDVLRKARVRKAAQIDWSGEVKWTRTNTILFPAISVLAGVTAGVFGLGGGIVFTPLMLELGTHPQVTAATTQTMLLFTTGASTVVFAQMGDIPWDFAAVIMATAFICTLIGQAAVDAIVRRAGRGSVVVIVLAAFFSCACLLSFYVATSSVVSVVRDPSKLTKVQGVC